MVLLAKFHSFRTARLEIFIWNFTRKQNTLFFECKTLCYFITNYCITHNELNFQNVLAKFPGSFKYSSYFYVARNLKSQTLGSNFSCCVADRAIYRIYRYLVSMWKYLGHAGSFHYSTEKVCRKNRLLD